MQNAHLVGALPISSRGLWRSCVALSIVLSGCSSLGRLCCIARRSIDVALRFGACCLALLSSKCAIVVLLTAVQL